MDATVLTEARVQFDRAFQSMNELSASRHFAEIEMHWSNFLVAARRVLTKIEQASKSSGTSSAWWGRRWHEVRTDPLLVYVYHARNADEHGLLKVTTKSTGAFNLIPPVPGKSFGELQVEYPRIELSDVVDRGQTYTVPREHEGQSISDPHPLNVGLFALRYLEKIIQEAETMT